MEWSIVTGAGSGIGAALTRRLVSSGHTVLAVGRRLDRLEQTAASCQPPAHAQRARAVPCSADVASLEGRSKIASALPDGATVKFLVHNAAVGVPAGIGSVREDDFQAALSANVVGPLFLTQLLLPRMVAGSRILHIGTGLAHGPSAQIGAISYSVSKAAFHRLHEQLKVELAPHNISVGSARPGVVATEGMLEHVRLAREAQLPHVKWFDGVLERKEDVPVARVAAFLEFLLVKTESGEFGDKEWHVNDQLYSCMLESATSEVSARMQAMENATKNCGQMINKLTLHMNMARQAMITQELGEIVSGAAAVEAG